MTAPGSDPLIGHMLGAFKIVRLLARGGMGHVYLGTQPAIGARVAVKVLSPEGAGDGDLTARFFAEARTVNLIHSENIVDILDLSFLPDGRPYIVMEYVPGVSLGELFRRHRALPPGALASIVGDVLAALRAAHAKHVVHRDLKPANIMVTPSGRAKVLDFGIAKLVADQAPSLAAQDTRRGSLLGTPHYMAPEQATGDPVDERADLYSLGVILYEGATGVLPFEGKTTFDVLRQHVERAPPRPRALRPELPAALEDVIGRALAKEPAKRYASAGEMASALAEATAGLAADVAALVPAETADDGARAAPAAAPESTPTVPGRQLTPDRGRVDAPAPAPAPAPGPPPRRRGVRIAVALGAAGAGAAIAVATTVAALGTDRGAASGDAAPAGPLVDVATRRALTRTGACAWAPAFVDEQTVVFDRVTGDTVDLYWVAVTGGDPAPLVVGPGWDWRSSPGRRAGEVLYLRDPHVEGDAGGIYAVDLATRTSTPVVRIPTPSAAAAGDAVYYATTNLGDIRRVRGDREDVVVSLPRDLAAADVVAARDGRRLAFVSAARDLETRLCVLETATGAYRCLAKAYLRDTRPWFSPDGARVYFGAADGLRRLDVATLADELVAPGIDGIGGVTIAPDGAHLVWSTCAPRSTILDVTAAPPRAVIDGDVTDPATGPGGVVAYVEGRAVMLREPDGKVRQLSSTFQDRVALPELARDGLRVAFVARGTEPGIYVVSVGIASRPVRLTDGATDTSPVWLADGRVVFNRSDAQGVAYLYVVDPAVGGEPVRAVPRPLRVRDRDPRTNTVLVQDGVTWLRWDPATGKTRPADLPLTDAVRHLGLSPSGTWAVTAQGRQANEVFRMRLDVAGAALEPIYRVPEGATASEPAIDDDGRVYVPVSVWTGELEVVAARRGRSF